LSLAPVLAASILWPCLASAAKSQASLEQAVKASYLIKFAPFVEWPPRAFPPGSKSFLICIAGEDPFGTVVDEVARGQKVRGRPSRCSPSPTGAAARRAA
jgi:hypothetical protein